MVYLRHPKFSSQIVQREFWSFLQLCQGLSMDELSTEVTRTLGIRVTPNQMRSTASLFAEQGFFEGTSSPERNYRIFDPNDLSRSLARLVPFLTTKWFAAFTFVIVIACCALLIADWGRFVEATSRAARAHPLLSIVLYYVTFIPVALLHELGHAIVVRSSGGEVPEVVIRSNAHFAVLSNKSVIKDRARQIWYLSMGTVVDIYVWLALLLVFHFIDGYIATMFLLPQTIYFLLYSYSIFNNSDFLKVVAIWFSQPVPAKPWQFLRKFWLDVFWKQTAPRQTQKLAYVMTAALIVKLAITALLIVTFLLKDYVVLVLYAIYKSIVYVLANRATLTRRFSRAASS